MKRNLISQRIPQFCRGRHNTIQCYAADATVRFSISREVGFGESHKIVGSHPVLGGWDIGSAPAMQWSDGNVWTLEVPIPAGAEFEFKCAKVAGDHTDWEGGSNRVVKVPEAQTVTVGFEWSNDGSLTIEAHGQPAAAEHAEQNGHAHGEQQVQQPEAASPSSNGSGGKASDDDRLPHQQWQGGDVRFMKSNEHSKERAGVWNKEGLQGAPLAIVSGDEKSGSWLGKLQVAKSLLVDQSKGKPDLDTLASAYIYLQLISTGAIACVEGGGHYRPNKHAELARDMFRVLELAIANPTGSPAAAMVARKTQTKLPSFTAEYTQSTPLTRIRDIAHRGDIPHELKQEIKHTIQNKLHRNAGPEDLVATEQLLARCQAKEGEFSADFLKELTIFAQELKDFFNAGSFTDMLDGIRASLDEDKVQVLDQFVSAKAVVDSGSKQGAEAQNALMDALHSLTSVRALLASGLGSGLRNDAPDAAIAMRQRWRLCEIRAEDYAFVLLSRFVNALEEQGGSEALAAAGDGEWSLPLGGVVLGVRQMGLSGWEAGECLAVENELAAWQAKGKFKDKEAALRLKASLERVQRITHTYTDAMLEVFSARANQIGRALGLQDERVSVFTEAEVRASVVFQLSKLCSLLLKATRLATGGAEWDALVAGSASGKLVEVERLEAGALAANPDGPVVLLVRSASGDEEVGALGVNLAGVILCHGLPHLSHLGVRARQEKVVFVMCEDEATVDNAVRPLIGSQVCLTASVEGVSITAADKAPPAATGTGPVAATPAGKPASKAKASTTEKVKKPAVVALADAKAATCGSKSACCGELARMAAAAQAAFLAPPGVVFPFGTMELAIREAGKEAEFRKLVGQVEGAPAEGGALDEACNTLQALVAGVAPPKAVLKQAAAEFDRDATLIVRSSANVEDLAGMSGAGLYDSLPNVPAGDLAAFGAAVAGVWASLYTRRAVLSRRAAGVAQAEAAMAVLVQEQVAPDLSFVLHTVSPLDHDEGVLYAELAAGLGETLASGTRGSPWRLAVHKDSGKVDTLAFANFSTALMAQKKAGSAKAPDYAAKPVDYSKQALSADAEARSQVGKRLAKVGQLLEKSFGGAQDVEGAFVGDKLYIVQTRPQP
ncbi:hypothetical protein WJX72_000486 [[Myrmecia] bisecta]|uniref:CBM20 domain-containing protein n=1 Tax=[Myrmecia] bisecta TaxID=41462 RepID=A0AAW1PEL6_9CHLO